MSTSLSQSLRASTKVSVCLGSGPSLTQSDIEATAHLFTIAVNSTWKVARHCDVIYAGDLKWWTEYGHEVDIGCHKVTHSKAAATLYRLEWHANKIGMGYNSGMLAIDWAIRNGAETVLLLGFDGSVKHGIHHHGPHEKTHNPDPRKCKVWMTQFRDLAKKHKGKTIINCSRYTEIKWFPTMPLEEALCALS